MAQTWSPRDVLNVHPEIPNYPCVGMGKKKPCGNSFISGADRYEACAILDSMAAYPPTAPEVLAQFETLAYLTLCPRWHRDKPGHSQVSIMQRKWAMAVREFAMHMRSVVPAYGYAQVQQVVEAPLTIEARSPVPAIPWFGANTTFTAPTVPISSPYDVFSAAPAIIEAAAPALIAAVAAPAIIAAAAPIVAASQHQVSAPIFTQTAPQYSTPTPYQPFGFTISHPSGFIAPPDLVHSTPAATLDVPEELSDFEDSGIDMTADLVGESSEDISDSDQEGFDYISDTEQDQDEANAGPSMVQTPLATFTFGQQFYAPPSTASPLSDRPPSPLDFDVDIATDTLDFEETSPSATEAATPVIPSAEPQLTITEVAITIDLNDSEPVYSPTAPNTLSTDERTTVALSRLSTHWHSFHLAAKDYATRYSLFNFNLSDLSWSHVQDFVGNGTNRRMAGFVGIGCVLWWALRGPRHVNALAGLLWPRRR